MPGEELLSKDQIDELLASVTAGEDISCGKESDGDTEPGSSLHVVDFLRREILSDTEKALCERNFLAGAAAVARLFGVEEKDVTLSFIDTLDFMTIMRSMPRKCLCAYMGTASGFSIFADVDPEAKSLSADESGAAAFLSSLISQLYSALFSAQPAGTFRFCDNASLLPLPADPAVVMAVYQVKSGGKDLRCAVIVPSFRFSASFGGASAEAPSQNAWAAAVGRKGSFGERRFAVALGTTILSDANAKKLRNNSLMKITSVDISPSYLIDLATGRAVFQGEAVIMNGKYGFRVTGEAKDFQYIDPAVEGNWFCLSAGIVKADEDMIGMLGEGSVLETDTPDTALLPVYCSNGIVLPCYFSCNGETGWARIFMR